MKTELKVRTIKVNDISVHFILEICKVIMNEVKVQIFSNTNLLTKQTKHTGVYQSL
jgi:hypothetical protein